MHPKIIKAIDRVTIMAPKVMLGIPISYSIAGHHQIENLVSIGLVEQFSRTMK